MSVPEQHLDTGGWIRRDTPPHRGRLLSLLALVSAVLAAMSCSGLPGIIALPLALAVLFMARHDLRLIARGMMDPQGAAQTRLAREFSIVAIVLLVATVLLVWLPVLYHQGRMYATLLGR